MKGTALRIGCIAAFSLMCGYIHAAAATDMVNVGLGGSSVDTAFYLVDSV